MPDRLGKSLTLPMLVALGAAGILGTSWIYTASDFFSKYGAGGEIFGMAIGGLLATCVALAYAELASRFPFYCTVLTATAWIIPWQQTAGLKDGVIDAFRTAGYPILSWGAYGIAVLGLLTSFLALFSAASHLILALARAGLFPVALARLSRNGQPIAALIFTLVLTLGFGALGKAALLWFLDTGGIYSGGPA